MATHVYCPRPSNGALELVHALGAKRLRRFDGMDFWDRKRRVRVSEGDIIVCWGASIPEIDGVRVLNSEDTPISKRQELRKLVEHEVPTVQIYDTLIKGYTMLKRTAHHQGGADLLFGLNGGRADFYTLKEDFVNEYRIHSFNGRSIRAGVKVLRDGFTLVQNENEWRPNANLAHPWIRSYDGGWRINYDGFASTAKLRKVAHAAVKALGLTFGAVDIGQLANGNVKVLEVNRAPGIEGGSIQAYVRAINKWIEGKAEPDQEG